MRLSGVNGLRLRMKAFSCTRFFEGLFGDERELRSMDSNGMVDRCVGEYGADRA